MQRKYHEPVCQRLLTDIIDCAVVLNFFAALSQIELDAYTNAIDSTVTI
ncbi:hypothetical protein L2227_07815 [Wolbachia endosymbiont of Delia radicum]|nr:hypothetical protein [Wolbachia endosymbiont of Delia radicum]UJQ21014.1 hypothetical protein L2227_07815 [Wolbachia endosymbiont of Delia radicum]